ncbi:MAG: CoA-binding protein [Alphaproteobacteria bacterium]|nr:CoA-binding protein [Alphaproteobacteria bacterium]
MSILIDETTRVLVQGITGSQARVDTMRSLEYGTRIVAGVTPGREDQEVCGVPVYDTVKRAQRRHEIDATVVSVPPGAVKEAVLEAIDAGIPQILVPAEFVPTHDVLYIVAAARDAGVRLIGCNTNGVISPGRSRIGGIGGGNPAEIYVPGRIGVVSRSGGMCAEIGITLKDAGLGVSTCVAMGGDQVTGLAMADYVTLFQQDEQTDAIVLFGEPGTDNEQGVAKLIRAGRVEKPIVALIAGSFQERYPPGVSFGHAAAIIGADGDSATAKRDALAQAGATVVQSLEEIPTAVTR